MINIETKFKSLTWTNGQFAIFRMEDGTSAKGDVLGINPDQLVGSKITLIGDWESHPKFGKSFKFERYTINEDQVIFFLTKVIGNISEKVAIEIKEKFGDDLWSVMDQNPERLLDFKGIGEKKLKKILHSWEKNKSLLKLAQVLAPHGVTNNQIAKIHQHFGEASLDVVLKEPYRIIEMRGIGFKLADEIALKLGHSKNDPARMKACAEYAMMETFNNGHSATKASVVLPLMEEILSEVEAGDGSKRQQCLSGLENLLHDRVAQFLHDPGAEQDDVQTRLISDELFSSSILLSKERYILDKFQTKRDPNPIVEDIEQWITDYQNKHGVLFGDEQKEAIKLANLGLPIFSVSGFAGTGKTTVSRAILALLTHNVPSHDVVCLAIAGIAANRVKDKSGFDGKTIHSALGFNGTGYNFNEKNPLPHRIVLLDEAGMPDSDIMYRVLSAVDLSRTTLILMGDPAQLQPVGSGQPYADALNNQILPNVTLTKVYRTSEDQAINIIAQSIRRFELPKMEGNYEDFGFQDISIKDYYQKKRSLSKDELKKLRDENNTNIRDHILKLAQKVVPELKALISPSTAWKFITRFQVITPMRAGITGVEEMNAHLQEVFNPKSNTGELELKSGNKVFRKNDKVVHLVNTDMEVMSMSAYKQSMAQLNAYQSEEEERRVMNGQLGVVIDVKEDELHVYYPIEKYIVVYSANEINNGLIQHSYALTVHKTQGSEYTQVAFPVTMSHFNMLTPQLFYTAVTRAKNRIDVVGEMEAVKVACRERAGQERVTAMHHLNQIKNKKPALRPV